MKREKLTGAFTLAESKNHCSVLLETVHCQAATYIVTRDYFFKMRREFGTALSVTD